MSTLASHLLGGFRLTCNSEAITVISQTRQQSLLIYLLLRYSPLSRQHLTFLFWPTSNETQAQIYLRKLLQYFRHSLLGADRSLQSDAKNIKWMPDGPLTIDVVEFENKIAQANAAEQSGQMTEVAPPLAEAVELSQRELRPGCYDDWILYKYEQFQQQCTKTLERLVLRLKEQRDYKYSHSLRAASVTN